MSQLQVSDLSKLKVNELKEILRKNNIATSGKKDVLLNRVKDLIKPRQPLSMAIPAQMDESKWVSTSNKGFMNNINDTFSNFKLKPLDKSANPCDNTQPRGLFEHQKFLKKYFTSLSQAGPEETNRGIFLYHSVGSGKTKSAVIMAEGARPYYVNGKLMLRKVIGLIPASLRNSPWIKEVSRVHPNYNSDVLLARIGYHFLHYNNTTTFKDQLKALIDTKNGSKNPFDNSIVIIDEVHNILNSLPSATDSTRLQIYQWMMNSKNTKFIMLSGTPISNTPYELAFAVNILRGQEVFPVSDPESKDRFMSKFFRDDKMINKQLLMRNIQGLFSYFIGADPRAFAKKVLHNVQVPMSSYQWDLQNAVYKREQDIAKRVDGTVGVAKTDIASQIKTMQRAKALKATGALKKILGVRTGNDDTGDNTGSFKVYARSNSNFAYPKTILNDYAYDYFPEILNPKHFNEAISKINLVDDLPVLSAKMAKIMDNIKKAEGPIIVFSNFEGPYGIRLFANILEAHGYASMGTNDTDINKMEQKPRYTIWSGATGSEERKNILNIFNNKKNKVGEYVKIICITTAGKEGISLRGIRQIHIMEPWWNMNRPLQVIGRGVRICSHEHLPPKDRVVDIFNYFSVPDKKVAYVYPAVDLTIIKNALAKQKKDTEFLQLLRESSIDCFINQEQSNVKSCINLENSKKQNIYSTNINTEDSDFNNDIRVKEITYKNKKYLLRGNLVFTYLTEVELNSGTLHNNVGIADIDLSGTIKNITFTDNTIYETIEQNGRKYLRKNGKLFQYLSMAELRNGLKPVPL
jgi:hypothetical protein